MALERDLERAEDLDNGTIATESTIYQEKAEPNQDAEKMYEGATGDPDSDHEEIEQMDEGHLDDLVRRHVSGSSRKNLDARLMPSDY